MKTKSKLRSFFSQFGLLFVVVLLAIFHEKVQGQSQYGNYAEYSTLTQGTSNSGLGHEGSTAELPKNVDFISKTVGDETVDQSQRSYQTLGKDLQGRADSQSVYYYQMFPSSTQPKPTQMCTYTGSGMKCQFKRDSTSSGGGIAVDSYAAPASPSYNVPTDHSNYAASSYHSPSSHYGTPSHDYGPPAHDYGPPSETGSGYGWGMMNTDSSGGGGGLGGLSGLIGLKGLKALVPYAFVLPFVPLLIPLVLLILLLPILPLILLLPIPVIVTGPGQAGRAGNNQVNFRTVGLSSMLKMASDVLESDECVEKLSCEIARMSRKYNVSKWTDRITAALPKDNRFTKKIRQGFMNNSNAINGTENVTSKELDGECSIFICKPRAIAAKYFIH